MVKRFWLYYWKEVLLKNKNNTKGGTCNVLSSTQYTCTCPANYAGQNCASFLACSSVTCQNGG